MSVPEYKSFIGITKDKYKTPDLNLISLVTHKGSKIDDTGFFRGVANRKEKDWFTFKEGEVDAAQLSDALKYVGSDTDI